jgi:hypothetical protein
MAIVSPVSCCCSSRSRREAAHDWMRYVPKIRILGAGFGADPAAPGFGARRFAAGGGGHSDYLSPGGVSLRDLALIALGRADAVSR